MTVRLIGRHAHKLRMQMPPLIKHKPADWKYHRWPTVTTSLGLVGLHAPVHGAGVANCNLRGPWPGDQAQKLDSGHSLTNDTVCSKQNPIWRRQRSVTVLGVLRHSDTVGPASVGPKSLALAGRL